MHPGIHVMAHPECPPDVLAEADFVGSTSAMIDHVGKVHPRQVAMITECAMAGNVAVEFPDVEFIQPCNLCPHMQRITLPKILQSLQDMSPGHRRARRCRPAGARSARAHAGRRPRRRPRLICHRFCPAHRNPVTPSAAFDVVVLGGGLGGLSVALRLADAGLSVGVMRKKPSTESSSAWAQGGIAAAIDVEDSPARHAADTLEAGAGLCRRSTVDFVVNQAPEAIRWLQDQGVEFTAAGPNHRGALHLTREGGHSRRRIVHAADATGQAVIAALEARVAEHDRHPAAR